MRPVICLVTDRKRAASTDVLVAQVAAAARAGVDLVQIRERDLDGGPLMALVRRCVDAVRSTRARILVNDRLDVALAAGAHGVHLRGDSFPASRARAITPGGFLMGRSIHDASRVTGPDEAALDYLLFGTVFQTASKPGRGAAGIRALAGVSASTAMPVLAVGGITLERLEEIARAGAAGFAAIGLFADAPLERLPAIVDAAHRAFGYRPDSRSPVRG